MKNLDLSKFQAIRLEKAGTFYIVPAELLESNNEKTIINIFNENQQTIGELVKIFRAKDDLLQKELAGITGLAACLISDLEKGKIKRPQKKTIDALSKHFGKDFENLCIRALSFKKDSIFEV
jgi:DNA-binding XRE family transcriptional regulator